MPTSFRSELCDGVASLTFDQAGSKVNTLGTETLVELDEALRALLQAGDLEGVVFLSGKREQCIAGADLREIQRLSDGAPEELAALFALGHRVFGEIANSPWPVVGLVDGPALGGGLELLLACDALVAVDGPKTRLGLPEVKLGVIPAWGGTQRLPRRIDPGVAIERLITGEPFSSAAALEVGLVDAVVARGEAKARAIELVRALNSSGSWREVRPQLCRPVGIERSELGRLRERGEALIGARSTRGEAQWVVLDVALRGMETTLERGLALEQEAAVSLFRTSGARNRVSVFFLRQRVARGVDRGLEQHARPEIAHLGVVGAGTMGAAIAGVALRSGIRVTLVDADRPQLARARDRIDKACRGVSSDALGDLTEANEYKALATCDLVVEAVPELESVKRGVLSAISAVVGADALIATNTSSYIVSRLAQCVSLRGRFAGLHFFNPVERMELVEVVRGPDSDADTIAALVRFARRLGKFPVVVGDGPGFLVNRVLFAYLSEALRLHSEGAAIAEIDAAAKDFGMPVGPFALMDWIGLDTVLAILRVMAQAYPDRFHVCPRMAALVNAGELGKKSGGGFTVGAETEGASRTLSAEEMTRVTNRLMLAMLVEATRALEDGIAPDPDTVDLALLLGIGFPEWRGGLFRWADELGLDSVIQRLRALEALGDRFAPTRTLLDASARHGLLRLRD